MKADVVCHNTVTIERWTGQHSTGQDRRGSLAVTLLTVCGRSLMGRTVSFMLSIAAACLE